MGRNLFYIVLAALAYSVDLSATIVQKVTLKDGSVLEGYIMMQRPGASLQFSTDRAEIILPDSLVSDVQENHISFDRLAPEWKKWADENDAFEGEGAGKTFVLHTIVKKDNTRVNNVRLLERGARYKYLELSPSTHNLSWDAISVIRYMKRERNMINGLNRTYMLKNGASIEGQYIEEIPGKTVSVVDASGYVNVIDANDILKFTVEKVNSQQNIIAQSPLIDVLVTDNIIQHKGIIVEQNYNNEANYLLLQNENGATESIRFNDITEYRKEVNAKYEPLYDILLREGELVINRQKVSSVSVVDRDSFMEVNLDSCKLSIEYESPQTEIVVEANLKNSGFSQQFSLVKVADKFIKKTGYKGFSYEDLVTRNIQPSSIVTSANNTTKIIYVVRDKGYYAIYDSKSKSVILFHLL